MQSLLAHRLLLSMRKLYVNYSTSIANKMMVNTQRMFQVMKLSVMYSGGEKVFSANLLVHGDYCLFSHVDIEPALQTGLLHLLAL